MVKTLKIPRERIILLNEVIKRIAGKNTEAIVPILVAKKNINEFKIADKLKLTINQARNILYKLHAYDVVSFTRKKDKRKGWYIYFWTLDEVKSLEALNKIKNQEIYELTTILNNRQQRRFYYCPEDSIELNEETAMHHEFLCPECGKLLELADNEKKIKELKSRIEYVTREVRRIDTQIDLIKPKPRPPKPKKRKSKKKKVKKVEKEVKKKPEKVKKEKTKKKVKKKVKKKGKKKVKKKSKEKAKKTKKSKQKKTKPKKKVKKIKKKIKIKSKKKIKKKGKKVKKIKKKVKKAKKKKKKI